jgi:hypothetical protein
MQNLPTGIANLQLCEDLPIQADQGGRAGILRDAELKLRVVRQDDGPAASKCTGDGGENSAPYSPKGSNRKAGKAGSPVCNLGVGLASLTEQAVKQTAHLNESECGQMGVNMMAGTLGCTMDPPAATL